MTPKDVTIDLPRGGADADCGACDDRIVDALRTHEGVVSVQQVGKAQVTVTYDSDACSPGCIDEALADASTDLHDRFAHETVTVGGMDCSSCAATIERAVNRVDGVTACSVNFQASSLQIEFAKSKAHASELTRRRVRSLGFELPSDDDSDADRGWVARHRHELITGVAAAFTLVALMTYLLDAPDLISKVLYGVAIVIGGTSIARAGIMGLISTRRPDMKLLMTIAVVGAVGIGEWLEAALVVVLFSVGEALESYAVNRARGSLKSLVEMVPSFARVRRTDAGGAMTEDMVPIADVAIGDTVVVLPGEQVPADGTVTEGASSINQASITGESVPVDKQPGDETYAGTLNGEARLLIEVTSAPGDTTLDRIARAVADAQAQKAPSERWVDSFAAVYTPIVMLVAVLVMAAPPLLFGADAGEWFYRGLTFLLLACPCALVISTPVAVVTALGRASANGVLIKGGQHLEAAAGIQAVCLDKTGTITEGRPVVAEIVAVEPTTRDEVLRAAAAVEAGSEHPLAAAVVQHARAAGINVPEASDVEAARGFGVTGTVDGARILVGSGRFFADHPDSATAQQLADELRATGHTIIVVANDTSIIGAIGMRDQPRETSKYAIDQLHAAGVRRIALLTGDHAAAAAAIAEQVGIDDVHADLLPQDKVERLAAIEKQYGSVAMVGDGVNDAPALARATVGVAMGTGGSATAIETADVALVGDDLRKLAGTIGLARWTRAIVRQNIGFSLGTKAIAAVLALFGLVTLWMAVLVDVGATLLVVANGLRILRSRPIGTLRGVPMLNAQAKTAPAEPVQHVDHSGESCCASTADAHDHSQGDAHDHAHDHSHDVAPAHAHAHAHGPSHEDEPTPHKPKAGGCCGDC